MRFHRILVPTDFSKPAAEAAAWGASLAGRLDGQLTLLHVLDLPEWEWGLDGLTEDVKDLQVRLLEQSREKLRELAASLAETAGSEINCRARAGMPAREILGEIRETPMDLLVLSTHGRRGLAHALLGSVAEKLVRTSTCPVLTVKAGEKPPSGSLEDVLFATDLSRASLDALPAAVELARKLGGTLTALHALEQIRLSIGTFEQVFGLSAEQMQQRLETRARKAVREQLEPLLPEELELHVKLVGGDADEAIVREAAAGGHDVVVMATHGHSHLGEALLGSTAERVVRTSTVPVLTVRSAE